VGERPTLALRSTAALAWTDGSRGEAVLNTTRQSLSLAQSLADGGETEAAVARAENLVLAERARLAALEQDVLLAAAAAFAALARDQELLGRARENERRLALQLAATRDRLRFGDLTKTDLAQAEARAAGAVAERTRAEGDASTAAAEYERVAGEPPPARVELPEPTDAEPDEDVEDALGRAEETFAYQAARFELRAAEAAVAAARAAFRPRLAMTGEVSHVEEPSAQVGSQSDASLGATLQLPLYQGGGEYARLRQGKELVRQRRHALDDARRTAVATAAAAVEDLRTARARIASLEAQADAAGFAADGVRQEALAGARSVTDLLDAEADLYRAEVELARARATRLVAAYRLRAATGRMTAEELGLAAEAYDPATHYREVRNRWFGVGAVR
jgi:outer membrane protein